jgi:hypothetical protein
MGGGGDLEALARIAGADEEQVALWDGHGLAGGRRGGPAVDPGRDDRRLHAPRRAKLRRHRVGVGRHGGRGAREHPRARQPMPGALVGAEILRAALPGAVVDRQHVGRAGRDGGRGGQPGDVDPAEQAGQRRAAGDRGGAEQRAPAEAVAHEGHARMHRRDRRLAGDEGRPLVLAMAFGQRGQQPAREARHAAPGEQGARVDTHLHRERTV